MYLYNGVMVELSRTNTLPNRKYLITHSTMQGLCLDNKERGYGSFPRSPRSSAMSSSPSSTSFSRGGTPVSVSQPLSW